MENSLDEADLNLANLEFMLERCADSKSSAENMTETVIYLEKVCERLTRIEHFYVSEKEEMVRKQIREVEPLLKQLSSKASDLNERLKYTQSEEDEVKSQLAEFAEKTMVAQKSVRASTALSMSAAKISVEKAGLERVKELKRSTEEVLKGCVMLRLKIENQLVNIAVLTEELAKDDEKRDYKLMEQQMSDGCFQVSFQSDEIRGRFEDDINRLRRNRRTIRQFTERISLIRKTRNDIKNRLAHVVSRFWR